jgi:hypothetical protein
LRSKLAMIKRCSLRLDQSPLAVLRPAGAVDPRESMTLAVQIPRYIDCLLDFESAGVRDRLPTMIIRQRMFSK